jgi:hypothetical protein
MSNDVLRCLISDEEMLRLAVAEARHDGRKLKTTNYTAMIQLWYKESVARNDDSFEFKDLGDGTGVHLFRPYDITPEERDMVVKWREKRRKETELRRAMLEES